MFTSYQDYYTLGGEVRISREKMMSICLTWFPISGLGKPNLYHNLGDFTRMWEDCGGVSDYEELVGVTHRR